jgi:DNA uptake protein ComE-like DNA-binding protein
MLAREKELSADRAEAERRVSDEADEKLREHNEQLQARIRALESETEKRITEAVEKGEGSDETRIELERQIRADFEKELARRIKEIKEEADARAREEVDAARRAAELRFETEFKDREEALRREREASTEAANAAQRRLDEIAEQIEAAGKRVESAEAHLAEEHGRLQRDAAERLDAEMRRLQAESDAKIEEALVKVEADTRSRIEKDAERRLAEQKNALRAEAEERVRITTETVREETETKLREEIRALREKNKADRAGSNELLARAYERAERAEAEAKAAEEVRQGAEAEARSSAAEWVRVQIRSFHGDSEKDAEKRLLQVRREAEQEAERTFAGREQELAAELEEAARALRSAEHQLRDAESRAESAERKLGETSDEHLRRVQVQNETRFQALEERIKSVIDKASGAQAHAASVGIELPGRDELEKPEPDTEEQEAVEGTRGGLLRGRLHRAQAKRRKATAKPRRRGDPVDINKATFEQLREVGMSVTQATRVIAYRERGDGFESVDDLETVPGVTKLLKEIREQLTA